MSLKIVSAQMQFTDGVGQTPAQIPGLYGHKAANYAARGRENDAIFVFVSLAGPLEDNAATLDALKQAFVHSFHMSQGSVTAALRSAVYACNAYLVAANRKHDEDKRGALAAAIVRDDELFMAQVGEAYAYIGHSFGLEPVPSEQPEQMTPLGTQSGLDIRFTRNWLQSGDLLMLLDPRIAHVPTQRYVSALVGQSVQGAMASLTEQLNTHTARVLLVEFSEDAARSVYFSAEPVVGGPPELSPANPQAAAALPIRGRDDEARSEALFKRRQMLEEQARAMAAQQAQQSDEEPAHSEHRPILEAPDASEIPFDDPEPIELFEGIRPNPAPLREPVLEQDPTELAELAATAAPAPRSTQEPLVLEVDEQLDDRAISAEPAPNIFEPTDGELEAPLELTPVSPAEPVRMEPAESFEQQPPESAADGPRMNPVTQQSRKAASGILAALSSFLRWLAESLTLLRQPNPSDLNAPRGERFYASLIAVVVPIVVALVVSGVYLQSRERNAVASVQRLLQTTLNDAITLENEPNPAAARIRYLDVIRFADDADDRIEDNEDILRAKQIARAGIDRLDGVVRLEARTLYRYPDDVALDAIAIGTDSESQNHIYVLDRSQDFVDQHRADSLLTTLVGEPVRVLERGQGVQRHIMGDVLDIEWKPKMDNTTEAMVAVDLAGIAVSHFPVDNETLSSPLGASSEWWEPTAIESYIGRLYVLDRGSDAAVGQLWRYFPDGRNFTLNEDARTITLPDLTKAVDVAIDPEDASVLILYEDGGVRNYRNERLIWDETTLENNGLSEPLVKPTVLRVAGSGPRSSYYVLDPGSNRIIEISRAGNLLNQFRFDLDDGSSDILLRTSDMYVSNLARDFYLVVDNVVAIVERD